MSPPPVFTISGQARNVNLASGVVQVSGQVQVQGQVGANLSGCIGIRNCSGQVLATTGMSVTVNVYSNSGSTGTTSGQVVQIVSGMGLLDGVQSSGCYLPCSAADGFQASGIYLTGIAVSGIAHLSDISGQFTLSGTAMASGINLTSSAVVGIVSGMNITMSGGGGGTGNISGAGFSGQVAFFDGNNSIVSRSGLQVSDTSGFRLLVPDGTLQAPGIAFTNDPDTGIHRPASNQIALYVGINKFAGWGVARTVGVQWGVPDGTPSQPGMAFMGEGGVGIARTSSQTLAIEVLSGVKAQFCQSGLVMGSGALIVDMSGHQIPGWVQQSGAWAISGATFMSGGSIYIANGAYGSYSNYASGLTVSGHAFGIVYPGTYYMAIDGHYYVYHNGAQVSVTIVKNGATTLGYALNSIQNSITYSPTAQAAAHALNYLISGDIIDFQFSTVDVGQASIHRIGD